ncbi:pyruvate kinase [uncultured Imperialibacter sp.]|uniref:pyruvate kinase n=1 Tax=uncultured Imperialibacter sp. TaxID=1672639 RepID=UPI0030DB50BE|tara:strand:- start:188039 stop:189475 length:1437 start_codon:yes stop_codon:yes gene_type:complete
MESSPIFNKTKIIATVGPASNSKEMLKSLIQTGVDVFRLNFSHGSHEDHLKVIKLVRELNEEMGTHVALLQDLQGPKIRTRDMENGGVEIVPGQEIIITTRKLVGNAQIISTTYTGICNDVSIGDAILIDDGNLELKVLATSADEVKCRVVYGGILKSKKGINLPNTPVSAPSLTEKDEEDLYFGLEHEVDWIALSFVRKAEDVLDLKEKIRRKGGTSRIIAKIEKPEALKNIDAIIEAADGLMVARGDLGVEIPMEDVPLAQKMMVSKCNKAAKPVIIATQMMESMIENPRPTRAEANDVANAVMDGADTVMLSAESASGKFPIQSVKSMVRIITSIEQGTDVMFNKFSESNDDSATLVNDKLVRAAARLSANIDAKAILGMTKSGYTGFRLSSHRPKANIFIFTDDRKILNTMNLVWGIRGFYYNQRVGSEETLKHLEDILIDKGFLHKGDTVVYTGSQPHHWENRTNMMKVDVIE